MKKALVIACFTVSVLSAPIARADAINDALVQNLRNQADAAMMRAQTARNAADAAQWQRTAQMFNSQADAAERRGRALDEAARKIMEAVGNGRGGSGDN